MAKIAFNSTAGNQGGGGWEPLPAGDYLFEIDEVEQTMSSNEKPQLKISMHVVDGEHAGAKSTLWLSLVPQAAFRVENLLNAVLQPGQYEAVETGEVKKYKGEEQPIYTFEFDTDDMLGQQVIYEVGQREYPAGSGKFQNEFITATPAEQAAPAPSAKPVATAARPAATATKPAAAAQPARRSVRA